MLEFSVKTFHFEGYAESVYLTEFAKTIQRMTGTNEKATMRIKKNVLKRKESDTLNNRDEYLINILFIFSF